MVSLNDEQRMLISEARRIAENEFANNACQWEGQIPWSNLETLSDFGLLGISLPEEYGGGGMTPFEAVILMEAIGRVCPDTAYALPDTGAPRSIAMFGTEEIKEKYLPPVCNAEKHIALGISEPEAGSDVTSMKTHVERADDGELYLNGEKIWVSGADEESSAIIWAKFPDGMGIVVMDFDAPGVEIQQHYDNMFNHQQTQFYMEDVHIPEENVLVRGPEGFKAQLKALNWERVGNVSLCNAIGLCAFDKALNYAQQREQSGKPIGDFQGIEWKLADMAKKIELSRAITHQTAEAAYKNDTQPGRMETSIAKLYSAEMLEEVVSESLQIHGANGYQQGHPLEYLYRFARGRRIAAGTDEIQKNTISEALKRNGIPHIT
jgi:alkylation response protein AidB-like acyl-CoA dehydrogenase